MRRMKYQGNDKASGSRTHDKDESQVLCYNCRKPGHFKSECPYPIVKKHQDEHNYKKNSGRYHHLKSNPNDADEESSLFKRMINEGKLWRQEDSDEEMCFMAEEEEVTSQDQSSNYSSEYVCHENPRETFEKMMKSFYGIEDSHLKLKEENAKLLAERQDLEDLNKTEEKQGGEADALLCHFRRENRGEGSIAELLSQPWELHRIADETRNAGLTVVEDAGRTEKESGRTRAAVALRHCRTEGSPPLATSAEEDGSHVHCRSWSRPHATVDEREGKGDTEVHRRGIALLVPIDAGNKNNAAAAEALHRRRSAGLQDHRCWSSCGKSTVTCSAVTASKTEEKQGGEADALLCHFRRENRGEGSIAELLSQPWELHRIADETRNAGLTVVEDAGRTEKESGRTRAAVALRHCRTEGSPPLATSAEEDGSHVHCRSWSRPHATVDEREGKGDTEVHRRGIALLVPIDAGNKNNAAAAEALHRRRSAGLQDHRCWSSCGHHLPPT
nr:uncharacterized protein LOC109146979 [Ipomoea trifida]